MRRTGELRPARWWRQARPGHSIIRAALAVTVGLLLTGGLTMATGGLTMTPARAAITSTAKTIGTMQPKIPDTLIPDTLSSCLTGVNDSYEFYTWCEGTSPTSFRTISYCADGNAILGVEYPDGDRTLSYANCQMDSLSNTLNADWGILLCSNSNGTGTYQGYYDRSGDISWILYDWGNGNITTGGTTLCEWDTSNESAINPNTPPTPTAVHPQ
jgi:hypothetical protein